ncbi:MAG: isomerase [Alphaproteobacteria bacterium]|nr:MAG: isomerase [Alphaproteobacteria bacterium]
MTDIDLYQIDAFTDTVFGGNPAAVCPLSTWLPDEILKSIAAENNLSETAFFVPEGKGFHLRWFTPTTEIDLCGHATLASAYCIFENLGFEQDTVYFSSRSGELSVKKTSAGYTLNFPTWDYTVQQDVSNIEDILGLKVQTVLKSTKTFAILDSPNAVQNYKPDITKIKTLTDTFGLVITARGTGDTDFVSRLFAPQIGIDEDPVTGAIHCLLIPYWGKVLGKTTMHAKQLSARGGDLLCTLKDDRVEITGKAVLYMQGKIHV